MLHLMQNSLEFEVVDPIDYSVELITNISATKGRHDAKSSKRFFSLIVFHKKWNFIYSANKHLLDMDFYFRTSSFAARFQA